MSTGMNDDDAQYIKMRELVDEIYMMFHREQVSPSDGLGILSFALIFAAFLEGKTKAEILNKVGNIIDLVTEDIKRGSN